MLIDERITLNELCDLLNCYRLKYGEKELVTIGVTCKHEHFFIVGDEKDWVKLPVPQYKDKYSEKINNYINFKFD